MNAIIEAERGVSYATLEQVLASGDLSKLTAKQRLEYYVKTCESVGLNPLTRPFRFMELNHQIQLYATRDCADQLRALHKISVELVDKKLADGLFLVTARATRPDGRKDEDMGAVPLDKLVGEFRANAILKCVTKAKRRVTLSICGLGLLDETEVSSVAGARTLPDDPLQEDPSQDMEAEADNSGGNGDQPSEAEASQLDQAHDWANRVALEFANARSDAEVTSVRRSIGRNYAKARIARPELAAQIDEAEIAALERLDAKRYETTRHGEERRGETWTGAESRGRAGVAPDVEIATSPSGSGA